MENISGGATLPTLLQENGVLATKWSKPQEELDKYQPLDYIIDWIKSKLKRTDSPADRVLILKSATGSGKSAILPPELYHVFFEDMKRGIASLQPLVFNAVDIPVNSVVPFHTKEALRKMGKSNRTPLELGENIGYQTGIVSNQPVKGVTYMTIGTIGQQLNIMSDKDFMQKYAFIIVDEAHKRSISTDMVLRKLKRFVERNYKNQQCPFIIVTSATFDPVHFCDYLLSSVKAPERYQNIIEIRGQTTYPIHEIFLQYDAQNVLQAAIDTVAQIHQEHKADFLGKGEEVAKKRKKIMLDEDKNAKDRTETYYRDILIFVAGASDISKIKKGIDKLNSEHEFFKKYPVLPIGLTGDVVGRKTLDYTYIVDREIEDLRVEVKTKSGVQFKEPARRVIISTNVGEVGITYKALKHVIDTGYYKSAEHNPTFGADALILKPVTRGGHIQRKGRTGRRAPGYSFPMFTEKTYEQMLEDELPEMILRDVSLNILNILIEEIDPTNMINENNPQDMFSSNSQFVNDLKYELKNAREDFAKLCKETKLDLTKIDLIDSPSADALHEALEKLYILGAIDSNIVPTPVGFIMNKFRKIPIESIRMIITGYAWKAPISDLVTIAAFQTRSTDLRPRKLEKARKQASCYNMSNLAGLSDKAKEHVPGYTSLYQSLVVADDFINNVILFYDFQKQVERQLSNGSDQQLESLEKWCEQRGISFDAIVKSVQLREELIQTLALIGYDPFENSEKELRHVLDCFQNCSRRDLLNYVKNIKQCIFEGYKLNIAEWNPHVKAYISRQSHTYLPIVSDYTSNKHEIGKYGDSNPKFIIYDSIFMRLNPKTSTYVPSIANISILDGFIPIDSQFDYTF